MGSDSLPHNAEQLMRRCIESFEQLEVLVFLCKHRDRDWTSDLVAAELKTQPSVVEGALAHLREHDLVAMAGPSSFRCQPATPELDAAMQALIDAYRSNPIAVIQSMSTNAVERVRGSAIRMFADAFLIGRGKKNG